MKRPALTLLFSILTTFLFAQVPQGFNYQAVVRDNSGNVLPDQTVGFRISILETTSSGNSVYTETHSATTNDFGLANLIIGQGSVVSGTFSSVEWSADDHFIQIELDATGGSNYQLMGVSQLLSVPYALHTQTSTNLRDGDNSTSVTAELYQGDEKVRFNTNGAERMIIGTDGRVGINTSYPSEQLDVVGTVTADDYEYNSAQTRNLKVGGPMFQPGDPNVTNWNNSLGVGSVYVKSQGGSMIAPVYIPGGATITNVEVMYKDYSSADMDIYLSSLSPGYGYYSIFHYTTSTNADQFETYSQSVSQVTSTDGTLLFARVYCSAWPAQISTDKLELEYMKITYVVDKPD